MCKHTYIDLNIIIFIYWALPKHWFTAESNWGLFLWTIFGPGFHGRDSRRCFFQRDYGTTTTSTKQTTTHFLHTSEVLNLVKVRSGQHKGWQFRRRVRILVLVLMLLSRDVIWGNGTISAQTTSKKKIKVQNPTQEKEHVENPVLSLERKLLNVFPGPTREVIECFEKFWKKGLRA